MTALSVLAAAAVLALTTDYFWHGLGAAGTTVFVVKWHLDIAP